MFEVALEWVVDAHPLFYFLLLMAAGTGLPVSEDALAIWVGGMLGRDDAAFAAEGYFVALYLGVVLSDFWTYIMGRLAQRTVGQRIQKAVFKDPKKAERAMNAVRRYGNKIGLIQRFSVGARLPIAFTAGYAGVSPVKFFAGLCAGACITLPAQMLIGYYMRHQIHRALGVLEDYGTPVAAGILVLLAVVVYRRLKMSDAKGEGSSD